VHSAPELKQAAAVKGSEITIGTSIDESVALMGDVTDIDLIVPADKHLRFLIVGSHIPPSTTRRFRLRGPIPMEHSGGRVGALMFASGQVEDIIIDGVDLNGDDGEGGRGLFELRRGKRMAVVNVRGRSVGWGGLIRDVSDFVMAGSSLAVGQRPRGKNGYPEGWGVRGGDEVVYFRNRFEGTRYHLIRVHPHRTLQYAWIAENVFIDPHEARIVSAMRVGDSPAGARFDGIWAQCNRVYAHSKCIGPSMEAPAAAYSRITHNTFHGSFSAAAQRRLQAQAEGDHDYLTGNGFGPWRSPPQASKPGDPNQIPLPKDDPRDDRIDPGLGHCPGPQAR
jgi:hypothetical protein